MAALWNQSLVPQIDANGDPLVGAQVFFYNTGTTTPQTTYSDSGLSSVSTLDGDGAVVADANGRWPAIFLNPDPGSYRVRALDGGGSVLFDVDGVSVPQDADFVPPDAGATDVTLLARTGDIKARHGTGAHSGWVRAAGRTIGSASSGATERANADASDLFQFLWAADTTLSVSGGRGGTAAGDFAANKTIALPDYRERALVGLADMGNSASSLLSGNTVDNSEATITLGATVGVGTHTLTTPQLASHTHTGTTGNESADHTHGVFIATGSLATLGAAFAAGNPLTGNVNASSGASAHHTHSFTSAATGSGDAHPNVQPSALVTFYLKL